MIVSVAAADLPGWVNWVTSVATVIIALALVVAAFAFTGVAIAVRKMVPKVNGLVARMQEGALPVLKHGQDVAENVNYITTSVREDVQRFKGTLRTAQSQLERAAKTTGKRISDFNALLEVVQEEAEAIFLSTASTVRGVQAGAERLRGDADQDPPHKQMFTEEGDRGEY